MGRIAAKVWSIVLLTVIGASATGVQVDPPLPKELLEAHGQIERGNYANAISLLHQLQKSGTPVKGIHHELGVAFYRQADYVQAQTEFASAIQENPDDHEAVQLRGISLYQSGRPAEAIPLLKQVQAWAPEAIVESAYVLALAYIQTQNYEEARKQAARMYGVAADSAASYLFAARMFLRQGHDPLAQEYAERATDADPKLPLAHLLLGEFYLYKSNPAKAVEEFRRETEINPAYAGAYDRMADALIRTEEYGKAEDMLRRAILLDANATGPYIQMGKVQLKKKDYAQAISYLQRAVKMDPNNFITHHLLGDAYRGKGQLQEAERELKISEQLQSSQHPQLENLR
jgi:tetratricopeptide (TPR) repeat protein